MTKLNQFITEIGGKDKEFTYTGKTPDDLYEFVKDISEIEPGNVLDSDDGYDYMYADGNLDKSLKKGWYRCKRRADQSSSSSPLVDFLRSLAAWGGIGMAIIFGIILYMTGSSGHSQDVWIPGGLIVFFLIFAACIAPKGDDK